MKKLVVLIALAVACLVVIAQALASDARSENQRKVLELLQHARHKGITPFGRLRFVLNNGMTVATEDAMCHANTGEITTRGDAHSRMGPSKLDPRGLSQFGVK